MNTELERLFSFAFRIRIVFALLGAGASWIFLGTVAVEYNSSSGIRLLKNSYTWLTSMDSL